MRRPRVPRTPYAFPRSIVSPGDARPGHCRQAHAARQRRSRDLMSAPDPSSARDSLRTPNPPSRCRRTAPGPAASASRCPSASSATPHRSISIERLADADIAARWRTRGCWRRAASSPATDLADDRARHGDDPRRDRARRIRVVARPRGRAPQHREAADRARRRRRQAPAHRRVRATTRSRPTCGCGCATRSTTSACSSTALRRALLDLAERHADTIMPGFTHLQVAQPVTFGHHLLAYDAMLARDARAPAPIAAGASTGCRSAARRSPAPRFPIDRERVARELGFDGVCDQLARRRGRSRLRDRVRRRRRARRWCTCRASPRSWCCGRARASASSTLADRFCTGSSIMPQKKNPDVPELVRGKTGRVIGHLVALLDADEGPAARVQQGQPGRQGAAVRHRRHAGRYARDHDRPGRRAASTSNAERMRAAAGEGQRPPPISPITWCARDCRFATRTKRSRARCAKPSRERAILPQLPLDDLRASRR